MAGNEGDIRKATCQPATFPQCTCRLPATTTTPTLYLLRGGGHRNTGAMIGRFEFKLTRREVKKLQQQQQQEGFSEVSCCSPTGGKVPHTQVTCFCFNFAFLWV